MTGLEWMGIGALVISVVSLMAWLVKRHSDRFWNDYPNALKDIREGDNEWSRKKGWVR